MMGRLVLTASSFNSPREMKTSFEGSGRTPSYPKSITGLEVTSIADLTLGYDTTNPPTYKPSLPLSSGHMIQFRAASREGLKVVLTTRTSGTEPKVRMRRLLVEETSISTSRQIKYYLEGSGQDRDAVQNVLREVVKTLNDEWMQASLNNLGLPS
jgi:phosphoglucomutase